MSSSTAIGSASVILSANADGLAKGFEDAERRTVGFGEKLKNKLMGSGIGRALFGTAEYDAASGEYLGRVGGAANKEKGLLKGVGWAAIGAGAAGAVAGGIMKGFETFAVLPEMIRGLAEKATGPSAGPLQGMVAAMDRIGGHVQRLAERLAVGLGPAFLAVGDVAASWADQLGTLADKAGAALGAALSVAAELLMDVVDGVVQLGEKFSKWATSFWDVADNAEGAASVVFATFRALGKAAAYTWDTFKAGGGAIAWVAGKIVEGLGAAVEAFARVIDLAKELPDALRPSWVDDLSRSTAEAGASFRRMGEGLAGWGAEAVRGFGDSARRVDEWMEGVERRFLSRRANLAQITADKGGGIQLAGALLKDSREAYSVVTRFNTNSMVGAADPAKQQLDKMEEVRRVLEEIRRGLENAPVLRVF